MSVWRSFICLASRWACIARRFSRRSRVSPGGTLVVTCSGVAVSRSKVGIGGRPKAISKGVLPLIISWLFRAQHATRHNCLMVTPVGRPPSFTGVDTSSGSFTTDLHKSLNCFLKSLTAVSARFGQGVLSPVGSFFTSLDFQKDSHTGVKKAISAHTVLILTWWLSIHSRMASCVSGCSWEDTGRAHKRLEAPSRIRNIWYFFLESSTSQWSMKTRSPNASALKPLTRALTGAEALSMHVRHFFTTSSYCW